MKNSESRPWGSFDVLLEAPGYKVKRMTVLAGKRLSLQRHRHRAEHWYIVEGNAEVTLDGERHSLTPGMAIDIPLASIHRIHAVGTETVVFIEVQRGSYLGEDDIERLEDDFGR